MRAQDKIVGVDLGTTKIAAIIAEVGNSRELNVIGVGSSPSNGLKRGVIVNLDRTVESIKKAINEAERMAGCRIHSCYAGIAGSHIISINSQAMIAISKPGSVITKRDVERVIEQAKAVALPPEREIIHAIPVEFILDNERGIKDPIGMCGTKLEAEVHLVTAAIASAQNIYRAFQQAGIKVKDLVLQPLASAYAVLEPDEMDLGVVLLDIGGGTTDIAIFYDGAIRYTRVIGLGGSHITNDIAIGLRTPISRAEEGKKHHGAAFLKEEDKDVRITVKGIGGRKDREVDKEYLISIINPRVEEILTIAHREILKNEFSDTLAGGVVITGGTSHLNRIEELTEKIFEMPVKKGVPRPVGGLTDVIQDPVYATGLGLVLYGHEEKNQDFIKPKHYPSLFDAIKARLDEWFNKYF